MGNKIQGIDGNVYVIIGDGEANEGSIWESALLAANHKLNNLICIMDHNHSGDRALNLNDVESKFKAFGWHTISIDGHDHEKIYKASTYLSETKPIFILANTIKGKGIAVMENNPEWHHKSPNEEELKLFLEELKL